MKVFYASFLQETNTFCPNPTDLNTFRHGYFWTGEEIPENLGRTNTEISGFLRCFSDKDAELAPGIACWAVASGKVTDEAFCEIAGDLCRRLREAMPVDGVFLALHGAMVSQTIDDCEGELLERVRTIVGSDVPISVSLDYHANITKKMVRMADVMVGFRTYPHVDFQETGCKAAGLLYELMRGGKRPKPLLVKLPLIVPVEDSETGAGVCSEVLCRISELDRSDSLRSASLFCSQPWLDIREAGISLLFYTDGREEYWNRQMQELAQYIMRNKERFFVRYPTIEEAFESIPRMEKPVILVDSGDITTAGGLGDSTVPLRAALRSPYRTALCIVSKKAVAQAFAAGEGQHADICIGGAQDYGYNTDVTVHARVVSLSSQLSTITGKSFSGIQADSGRRAYLKVGENLHIVVAEYATLMYDPQFLRDMGIDPADMEVIVQKSHKLFRAAYQNLAKTIQIVDTPGFTDQNLAHLKFSNVPRPLYPLDHLNG